MNPEIANNLLNTLITLAASTIVSTIIGTIIKRTIDKKMDKNIKDQQDLAELKAAREREERKQDVINTLRSELKPIDEKIEKVSSAVEAETVGTTTLLRESMKSSRDQYEKKGCISDSERANWHELYNTYKVLGGNHFKEYVDEWKNSIDALPKTKKSTRTNTNKKEK